MTDKFVVVPDPGRKNGWRIERVQPDGKRFTIPQRFRSLRVADKTAYQLQVSHERQGRHISLGD